MTLQPTSTGVALLFASALFFISAGESNVHADQNDPALDALFAELRQPLAPQRAVEVTQQIWQAWTRGNDSEIDARMAVAARAMSTQDLDTALRQLDRVVDRAPDFSEGWNRRATVYYLAGDYRRSLADVRRTLALEPRHFGALSGRGLIYMAMARHARAIESFEAALHYNPHLENVKRNLRDAEQALFGEPL